MKNNNNTSTFYCSNMRTQGNQRAKAKASDEHNLRLEKENPNYDPDLSKNNIYLVEQNKSNEIIKLKSTSDIRKKIKINAEQIEKNDMKIFLNSCNNHTKLSQDKKNKLVKQRSDLKRKFKKWIDNEKTTEEEKAIFKKCLSNLENKKKYNNNFLTDFEKINSKISRRNDKLKAIEKIKDFDKIADLKNRNVNKKIISNEIVFKIPDKNNINVKAEDFEKLIKHFKNKYFKDYQMIYTAIHCDENPDNTHAHMKISGLNRELKTFNIPDHEISILKKHTENYSISNKKWCEYTDAECKKHGQLYQDFIFDEMNKYLKKLGYDINLEKRTEEQKKIDNHNYEKTKKSTKRGHNRQNKLNEINSSLENKNSSLENENNELKNLNKYLVIDFLKLEEKNGKLKEINEAEKNKMKDFFNNIIQLTSFISNKLNEIADLKYQEETNEINKKINKKYTEIIDYFKKIHMKLFNNEDPNGDELYKKEINNVLIKSIEKTKINANENIEKEIKKTILKKSKLKI